MENFTVHVGNVGTVYEGPSEEQAWERFEEERTRARFEESARSFLEPVHLAQGESVLAEWTPREDFGANEDGELVPSVLDYVQGSANPGDVYELGRYEDSEDFEEGGSAAWRSLDTPAAGTSGAREGRLLVLVPFACSGSDYNGGSLARANVRALRELAEEEGLVHFELHGGHGTHGVAFPLWERSARLLEVLEGLESYPVADEDALQEVEREEEEQAWDSWVSSDFARALEEEHGVDVSDVSDEELRSHFADTCERAGRYFEHSEEGPSVDLEELAEHSSREELLALEGAVSSTADEEERASALLRAMGATLEGLSFEDVRGERGDWQSASPAAEHFTGDRRPALEAWETLRGELQALRVLDAEEGPGSELVHFAQQVAGWPVELPLAEDVSRSALLARIAHYEETIERVRQAARAAVLPVLEDREGYSGRKESADRWERDEETGQPRADAFRDRVLRAIREEGLRHGEDKRRTVVLRYAGEEERVQALRLDGATPEDAARAVLRERVAGRLRPLVGKEGLGSGTLPPGGHGWADVLEVGDEDATLQRRTDGAEPERFPLERFLRRGDF